ncbi:MAG: DUF6152 family protein [Steroidobacteraceae bacterium]
MHTFTKLQLSCAAALLLSGTAHAHHSQAMFDMNKCKTVQGTVRTFQFQFPHSWLWVYVPNGTGEDVWGFEASAPANMVEIEGRWKRDVIKKGDKVTVMYSPTKDGRNAGALAWLALPDGKTTLRAATPACAGTKPPPGAADGPGSDANPKK